MSVSSSVVRWQNNSSLEALELLHQLTLTLGAQENDAELFVRLLEGVLRFCGGTSAAVYVGLPDGSLEMRHGVGQLITRVGQRFAPDEGVCGWVFGHGESVLIDDYQASALRSARYAGLQRSMIATPLRRGGRVFGVLMAIWDEQVAAYQSEQLLLLERFAAFSSVALENASLRAAQEQQQRISESRLVRREQLQKHFSEIIASLEPFAALHELIRRSGVMLEAVGGLVLLRDGSKRLELVVDADDVTVGLLHSGHEVLLQATLHSTPLLLNYYPEHPLAISGYVDAGLQGLIAVPLLHGDIRIGVVFFERHHGLEFDNEDVDFVLQIAPIVAGLLENARLYVEARAARSEAEHRAGLLEALYKTQVEVGNTQDVQAVAHDLLQRVVALFSANVGGIYLREADEIRLLADYGDELVPRAPLGYGVSGRVAQNGEPILLGNHEFSDFYNGNDPGVDWRAVISVPLRWQQHVLGALTIVDTRFPERFTVADVAVLERFAAIASLSLENVLLLDAARQAEQRARVQANQLQALHQASLAVTRHVPSQQLLRSLLERAANLLGANAGSVYMLQADGTIRASTDLTDPNVQQIITLDHGLSGRVIAAGLPLLMNQYQAWDGKPANEISPLWQAALSVPLHLDGKVIGALTLAHTTNPMCFQPEDLVGLERFAAVANVTLENAALLEKAEQTSLHNQRQTRLLEALYQTSLALAGQFEPSAMLQQVVDRVTALFSADAGAVYLVSGNLFERVAVHGESPSVSGTLGEGLSGKVIVQQQARVVQDYKNWDGQDIRDNEIVSWQAAMSAPLWRGDQVIGALTIADTRATNRFDANDLEALERFAAATSAALETTRLFDSLRVAEQSAQERTALMEALHEINLELGHYIELDMLLESILERAVMLFGAHAGRLYLLQSELEELHLAATIGASASPIMPLGYGASGVTALTGQALRIDDYQNWTQAGRRGASVWQSVLSVPLKRGKEITGALVIADTQNTYRFADSDLDTLERFAASASIALERAQLLDDARHAEGKALARARQLEALYQVSLEVSKNLEPEALLSSILERASALLGANAGGVFLIEHQEIVLAAGIGDFPETRFALGTGVSGQVAELGELLLIEDYQIWELRAADIVSPWRSVASVPLRQGKNVIGALTLADTAIVARFDSYDLETLERFAALASIALENARLYVRERASLRDERVRTRISQEVARLRSLPDLVRAVLHVLEDALGFQHSSLYLLEGQTLRLQGQLGIPTPYFEVPLANGVIGRVARSGTPELITDGRKDPDFIVASPDLVSLIAVPLKGSVGVLGTLNIESTLEQPLTKSDLAMIVSLSNPISTALENVLLHEQLERKASEMEFLRFQAERAARFDPLTNLRNRRAFDEDLQRSLEQYQNFGLAAIDLTGFKLVNDQFGHAAGDVVLARVAKVLASGPNQLGRASHKAYRTGGDEFALIIPPEQAALELLMYIVGAIEQMEFDGDIKILLNIGLASYPNEASNLDQLQSLADNRMYNAKAAGKPYLLGEELELPPPPKRRSSDRS